MGLQMGTGMGTGMAGRTSSGKIPAASLARHENTRLPKLRNQVSKGVLAIQPSRQSSVLPEAS